MVAWVSEESAGSDRHGCPDLFIRHRARMTLSGGALTHSRSPSFTESAQPL